MLAPTVIDHPPFKTKPFDHQLRELDHSWHLPTRGIFWEQGMGKSKLILDTAARLFVAGKIDGLFVLAPNGVHENWIDGEVPVHYPLPCYAFAYRTGRKYTRDHKRAIARLLTYDGGLAILTMAYDAIITEHGKATAKQFLVKRRCLYVLDESTRIKTPSARRTKTVLASAPYAPFRRILTGTPIVNGPFDVWAPMKFLLPNIWDGRGWRRFQAFRAYFGVFKKGWKWEGKKKREYRALVRYRYVEKLKRILDPHVDRVTKEDAGLDLPPKLYTTVHFSLSDEQQRLYDTMRKRYLVELESGARVTAILPITRILRLQQIACGYVPHDDDDDVDLIVDNARLKTLREIVRDVSNQTIIWARFRKDIDQIMDMLAKLDTGEDEGKFTAVRYDGAVGEDARKAAINDFQAGRVQFFVANPAAGSMGLNLFAARTVIYYSNGFKLLERLQSEDRAHRIGQKYPVQYIDLIAKGTVDKRIVQALRAKYDIARQITGDKVKEWISG